jgi:TolA-binding protein
MKKLIYYLVIIILLGNCAYYNTFYNAEQYFRTAQSQPLQANGKPSRNAIQEYNKAMKKCGIILTDYTSSKWADDALFMLSQCLYYQQKYVLAKEKFEEVVEFYPQTEFAQRASIYSAKCEYALGRQERAYTKLRDFLVSGSSKKYQVEAMNLLAEYYLENEVYSQAEHYYRKIIDNYSKSEMYDDAFFSLGLLYHRNGKYELSNEVFIDFLRIKTDKKMKLDARYYILYNYLSAGDYQRTIDELPSLFRQEYRDEKLAALFLLKARALAHLGDTEQADIIFEQVITDNDKTPVAAESYYWRAEMHFRILNNYENAIEYYNNVRTQDPQSFYIDKAVSHSAVASQIVQYNSYRADIELQQLVTEQMKLAEYYLEVLELPDSAMVVYDKIISYRDLISARVDSLQNELHLLEVDSPSDTVLADTFTDTLPELPDSLLALEDSLVMVLQDTTGTDEFPEIVMPTKRDTLQEKIAQFQSEIDLYDQEFVPYVKFVQLWVLKNVYRDSSRTEKFYNEFIAAFPDNKYSYAALLLMQNEEVEFITYEDRQQRERLDFAIDILDEKPDSAKIILAEIASDSTAQFYKDAIFSLGYLYYFVEDDTTIARTYFEEVLSWEEQSEWKETVSLLYSEGKFKYYERLPALVEREERLAEEARSQEERESELEEGSAAPDSTGNDLIMELEDIEASPEGLVPTPGADRSMRPKRP